MVGPQSVNNRGTSSSRCTSKLCSVSCLPNFTLIARARAIRQKKATAVALLGVTPKSKCVTQKNQIKNRITFMKCRDKCVLHEYIANHAHRPGR